MESEVQQAHMHQQFLTEHLFIVSDLADPLVKLAGLVDDRPQDVVGLLRVFGSISFTDVAYECCVRFAFLTCSSDSTSSRLSAMLRIPSVLACAELCSMGRVPFFCAVLGTATPRVF